MRWMELAWAHQGVCETPGIDATPAIMAMFADIGCREVAAETGDETPWCAAFVGACLERAGIRSTRSALAKSYETFGTALPLDQPRVGAVAVLRRGADGVKRHVAFVTGWTEQTITALGGNQDNSVNVQHFARADLVALAWPVPPATSAADLAATSRIAAASQRQLNDGLKTGAVQTSQGVPPSLPVGKWAEQAGELQGAIETLTAFAGFVAQRWPWIAAVLAAYWVTRMGWDAWIIRQARLEDHNTGKTAAAAPAMEANHAAAA